MNIFHKVTLRYLKENRTRTLVTIVGIILSAAMFTAVTTSVSTLQRYMIESTIYESGNWYGAAYGLSADEKEKLTSDSRTRASVSMELIGFAGLKDSINEEKPYLCVCGIEPDFTEMMPIHLIEGRLPENSGEILLPEHLNVSGGIDWKPGDALSLELGARVNNFGDPLTNEDSYNDGEGSSLTDGKPTVGLTERLVSLKERNYTVVGVYERPAYEAYHAPGYTALTVAENSKSSAYSLYLRTEANRHAGETAEQMFEDMDGGISWQLNYNLLRIYGYSGESSFNRVLRNLGAILILIIMFGSISLIYNAFSISVSERTKQFGLLASIGATKKQLIQSVLFESMFLSLIGIPLGILSGLLGIGITFYFVRDLLASVLGISFGGYSMMRLAMILGPSSHVSLGLHPSFAALAIAGSVALLTVLISAYIPARRAMKKSAIDAIRQSGDISVRARKVRTSRLTQKLFGFEGMLATKNYKRNRRKYRATVISLFLSVVLFISASSFCAYLTVSSKNVLHVNDYDLSYILNPDAGENPKELMAELSKAAHATAATYAARLYMDCSVRTADLDQGLRDYWEQEESTPEEPYREYEDTTMPVHMLFLADEDFRSYLKEQELPEDAFFDPKHPRAVAVDALLHYSGNDQKYHHFTALARGTDSQITLYMVRERENYSAGGIYRDENGTAVCDYYHCANDDEILTVPKEEACLPVPLSIGAVRQESPSFFADEANYLRLFYPYSMMDAVFSGLEENVGYEQIPGTPLSECMETELFFQTKDHQTDAAPVTELLNKKNLNASALIDYAASAKSDRAMITVINIFSYGFIILISLIAAANVFNTISTNINLRRREFAMLKSIGMTPKDFARMMNFECLLYGFKGLLYGLPTSLVITWMIYNAIGQGLEMRFFIPWYSIAIAVGSVFLVVFATMLYSMKRIRKENTIDTLKNENL